MYDLALIGRAELKMRFNELVEGRKEPVKYWALRLCEYKIFPNEAIYKARKNKTSMVSEMLWLHDVIYSPTEALIRKESAFRKAISYCILNNNCKVKSFANVESGFNVISGLQI